MFKYEWICIINITHSIAVGERGQITIPKEIRDAHNIKPKQKLHIFSTGEEIIIRSVDEFRNNLIERYKDSSIDKEVYSDFELTMGDGLDESS